MRPILRLLGQRVSERKIDCGCNGRINLGKQTNKDEDRFHATYFLSQKNRFRPPIIQKLGNGLSCRWLCTLVVAFSLTRWLDYFFNIWQLLAMKICPKALKTCQIRFRILPNSYKLSKTFKTWAKWLNFAQSGPTARLPSKSRCWCFKFSVTVVRKGTKITKKSLWFASKLNEK